MQLFSTFDQNLYLEMAITKLQKEGIKKEHIYAVSLDNRQNRPKLFDNLHRSDGTSLIDIGMALATAFSVVGTSIGFKLTWGPIIWGLLTATFGFILGVAIRLFIELALKRRKQPLTGRKHSEVILIIECDDSQGDKVESILWEHLALGVAKVK